MLNDILADHLLRKMIALEILILCQPNNWRAKHQYEELELDIIQYTDDYMDEIWNIPDVFPCLKLN